VNRYGFADEEWAAAKHEACQALIGRAKVRGMMPYSELVKHISTIHFDAYDQRLFHLLGDISESEEAAGRGMLSAIVVHKTGDMEPGPGFFELASKLGRKTSDKTKCWVEEIKRVYACWGED
jgi:molybdopterin synthase catalytic subunit